MSPPIGRTGGSSRPVSAPLPQVRRRPSRPSVHPVEVVRPGQSTTSRSPSPGARSGVGGAGARRGTGKLLSRKSTDKRSATPASTRSPPTAIFFDRQYILEGHDKVAQAIQSSADEDTQSVRSGKLAATNAIRIPEIQRNEEVRAVSPLTARQNRYALETERRLRSAGFGDARGRSSPPKSESVLTGRSHTSLGIYEDDDDNDGSEYSISAQEIERIGEANTQFVGEISGMLDTARRVSRGEAVGARPMTAPAAVRSRSSSFGTEQTATQALMKVMRNPSLLQIHERKTLQKRPSSAFDDSKVQSKVLSYIRDSPAKLQRTRRPASAAPMASSMENFDESMMDIQMRRPTVRVNMKIRMYKSDPEKRLDLEARCQEYIASGSGKRVPKVQEFKHPSVAQPVHPEERKRMHKRWMHSYKKTMKDPSKRMLKDESTLSKHVITQRLVNPYITDRSKRSAFSQLAEMTTKEARASVWRLLMVVYRSSLAASHVVGIIRGERKTYIIENRAALRIQKFYRFHRRRKRYAKLEWAALTIMLHYRRYRRRLSEDRMNIAADRIRHFLCCHEVLLELPLLVKRQIQRVIWAQRLWRRHRFFYATERALIQKNFLLLEKDLEAYHVWTVSLAKAARSADASTEEPSSARHVTIVENDTGNDIDIDIAREDETTGPDGGENEAGEMPVTEEGEGAVAAPVKPRETARLKVKTKSKLHEDREPTYRFGLMAVQAAYEELRNDFNSDENEDMFALSDGKRFFVKSVPEAMRLELIDKYLKSKRDGHLRKFRQYWQSKRKNEERTRARMKMTSLTRDLSPIPPEPGYGYTPHEIVAAASSSSLECERSIVKLRARQGSGAMLPGEVSVPDLMDLLSLRKARESSMETRLQPPSPAAEDFVARAEQARSAMQRASRGHEESSGTRSQSPHSAPSSSANQLLPPRYPLFCPDSDLVTLVLKGKRLAKKLAM